MHLNELINELGKFHPDSGVQLYMVVPPLGGEAKPTYLKLAPSNVYLEDDGAMVTVELKANGVKCNV